MANKAEHSGCLRTSVALFTIQNFKGEKFL